MYAQSDLLPWARHVLDLIPGVALHDAHVHVGIADPAGILATEEEVLEALAALDSGALVFALKEPAGYREPNRRMIELAAESDGRLRALCRLDPADDALGEARRGLEAGAAGLKLHPRGESFELADRRLDGVFDLAAEHRLPVMIHAGAGDAEVGEQALDRARRHPEARLILAHAAVGAFDLVVPQVEELGNVYLDTSWWNPSDVWALFRSVPPGRILYASDIPFASPAEAVLLAARIGIEAGLDGDQLRSVMGGQLERLIDRAEPLDPGPVTAGVEPLAPELERIYVTLCTVVEPMLRGAGPGQGMELARAACSTPSGPHAELIASIGRLLELADGKEDPDPLRSSRTPGFDLVLAAAILARTPKAGAPE